MHISKHYYLCKTDSEKRCFFVRIPVHSLNLINSHKTAPWKQRIQNAANDPRSIGIMNYGYVRVSTKEQNTDRQYIALASCGITIHQIFTDHQSGKDFSRPAYKKMLTKLSKGDLLVIKSIDRLGRNYDEILIQWRKITKEIEADILVIDMPLLDTRDKGADTTGKLISDIVLQLLAYIAETERDFIHQRQREGIAAARSKGIRFGRPAIDKPENYPEIVLLWKANKISAREAARRLGVNHKTFLKWAREIRKT